MFVIVPEEMAARRDDWFVSSLHADMALILFFKGHFNIIRKVKQLITMYYFYCKMMKDELKI